MTNKTIEEEIFAQQLAKAREAAHVAAATEPRAESAFYDEEAGKIVVNLTNGATFSFPPALGQGISEASPKELSEVEVTSSGYGLHWEKLDADLSVPGLMAGIFGTKKWMVEMGKKGGRSTSSAKVDASRRNGKKGGRPKKNTSSTVDFLEREVEYRESYEETPDVHKEAFIREEARVSKEVERHTNSSAINTSSGEVKQ